MCMVHDVEIYHLGIVMQDLIVHFLLVNAAIGPQAYVMVLCIISDLFEYETAA